MAPRCDINVSNNFYREVGKIHRQLDAIARRPQLERFKRRSHAEYTMRVAEEKLRLVQARIEMVQCVLDSQPNHGVSKQLLWALSCRRSFYEAQRDGARAVLDGKSLHERLQPFQEAKARLERDFPGFSYAKTMGEKLNEEIARIQSQAPTQAPAPKAQETQRPAAKPTPEAPLSPPEPVRPSIPPVKNADREIMRIERALAASVRGARMSSAAVAEKKLAIVVQEQARAKSVVDANPNHAESKRLLYALQCRNAFYKAQQDSDAAVAAGKALAARRKPFEDARAYITRWFSATDYGKKIMGKLDEEIARVTREMPKPKRVPRPLLHTPPFDALPRREIGARPKWNRDVFFTFDDGPDRGADGTMSRDLVDMIARIERQGVVGYRFYWNGIHCFRPDVQRKVMYTEPGKWRAFVEKYRGELSREEYIDSLLDPSFLQLAASLKAYYGGSREALEEHIGYHGMTHPKSGSWRHLQNLSGEQIMDDILFFQEILRVAFREPAFTVRYGRPPYGGGFFTPGSAQKSAHMRRAVERHGLQWRLWRTDTLDWKGNGNFPVAQKAAHAMDNVAGGQAWWDTGPNEVLLHSKYSIQDPARLDQLIDALHHEELSLQLELGPWTTDKINAMLADAWSRYPEAGERQRYIGEKFIATPFKKKRKLQGGEVDLGGGTREKLVVNLENLDCTTFVITTIALAHSRDFNDFLDNLKRIKYRGGRLAFEAKLHYTATRIDEGIHAGFFEDVTRDVGGGNLRVEGRNLTRFDLPDVPRRREIVFIPGSRIAQIQDNIRDGDTVFFVANPNKFPDIAFVHQAFASWEDGRLYFLHAKAGEDVRYEVWNAGARKGEKRTLASYVADNPEVFSGIVVMRPKNPRAVVARNP